MNHKKLNFAFVCIGLLACLAPAQEIKTEMVLDGLNRPASLALHPVDHSIYVAEYGANRVIKIADRKSQEVVSGFSPRSHSLLESDGGPASVEFLNANWLLVGAGVAADGPFQIQGFDLSTITENKPLTASDANATLDIGEAESKLNGHTTAMVVGSSSVLVSGLEASGKSFLATIAKSEANPETISLLYPEKQDAEKWLDSSGAMTISNPEGYLAFIQTNDSGAKLTFFSEDGEENGTFETGLKKVTAIAYGPNRGRLFLADRETGAIYKLIESDNDAGCESVKVHELANITAMRFNAAGELLVATLGETIGDESGQVVKLIGFDSVEDETKEGE